uniref:ANKLE2 third alpha/beta domain-containing protein n=1 Tax=Anopheles farauti TaxID=69004 RepID=A0A182QJ51_9DIPT
MMEYYAIFVADNTSNYPIKSFYNDRAEALSVLKQHKDARMKAFATSEEAVSFYLHGPSEPVSTEPVTPTTPFAKSKATKTKFVAPTSQKLVAFRKLIEANKIEEVRATIFQNPRYLISSGDTPTILKEGPRYNALHITAIEGRDEICRMILRAVSSSSYVELLHGQRLPSTDDVSAVLLDLYLNTPDKCRNETPLHFAAKLGWTEVVRELIAYPQCQIVPNGDGLYPKDIVCSRARQANNTEERKEAIRSLLRTNFFVPVIRTENNVGMPMVGEPFSPTDSPKLVEYGAGTDRVQLRREIRAYAGPMDQDQAQTFCKRWKTPPRLKVVHVGDKMCGESKSEGKLNRLSSSTPIRAKPRRLFANHSVEELGRNLTGMMLSAAGDGPTDSEECVTRNVNNNLEPAVVTGEPMPDDNGNHTAYDLSDGAAMDTTLSSTPYRKLLSYRCPENDSMQSEESLFGAEMNVTFECEATARLYTKEDLLESPWHKERLIKLTDPEKGLETVGRMLASKMEVGWQEYWEFLDGFCNLADEQGLKLLEQYLAKRAREEEPDGLDVPLTAARTYQDDLDEICESTEKMCLEERQAKLPASMDHPPHAAQPAPPLKSTRMEVNKSAALSNRYRCLLNSLHVFATRLAKILGREPNLLFVIEIRKLDKLLENYRQDAGFDMVDFRKAHALFAYLIVAHGVGDGHGGTAEARVLPHPDMTTLSGAAQCVAQFIVRYANAMPPIGAFEPANESEESCRRMWDENECIPRCDCPPVTGERGILERVSQRRDMRANRMLAPSPDFSPIPVDFSTYREELAATGRKLFGTYPPYDDDSSSDEYFSCSDSDSDERGEPQADEYFTAPSSPILSFDDGELPKRFQGKEKPRRGFLHGGTPTREDYAVLNALRSVEIDPQTYPHVYGWKCAMAELGEPQPAH